MNGIVQRQNSDTQLMRLAAQRRLYSIAKKILLVQLVLLGPLAATLTVIAFDFSPARGWIAAWSLCLCVMDFLWLTPQQQKLRDKAARIQEEFDCDVLELAWSQIKVGARPTPEDVRAYAEDYVRRSRFPPLTDWYPRAVASLPLPLGRIICQRVNCWWDAQQRRRYVAVLIGALAVVSFGVLIIGIASGATVDAWLLGAVMPLLPAFLLAARHAREHLAAAKRLDELRAHAESAWSKILGGVPEDVAASISRALQDEIFDSRKRNTPTLDRIFRLLRPAHEAHMNQTAEDFVQRAREAIRGDNG